MNEVFYRTAQQDMDMDDVASFASESINGGYAWWGQDGGYSSGQIVVTHSMTHHVMDMQNILCSTVFTESTLRSTMSSARRTYFNQQCSLDALYNEECPKYDDAYFDQQCMFDPQYDSQCAGYVDPTIFEPEVETDFGYDDDDMGSDDGSDDGSDYNEFGIEEEEIFYFEPEQKKCFLQRKLSILHLKIWMRTSNR